MEGSDRQTDRQKKKDFFLGAKYSIWPLFNQTFFILPSYGKVGMCARNFF